MSDASHKWKIETRTLSATLSFLRDVRRRYKALYEMPIVAEGDGSFQFHEGRLYRRGGINVLSLRGDAFEMAFQHGRLLQEAVQTGVLPQLSRTIPNILTQSVSKSSLVNKVLVGLLDYLGRRRMRRHIPENYLLESIALAEGAKLPLHTMSNALLAMEALYVFAKFAVKIGSIDINPMAFAGCSSFAVWDPESMIVGRNVDYPLNGYFDKHPTVTYFNPTDGGQKYLSIGTAGLVTPFLTAVNESGIYIAGHIVPTAESSFDGTPIFFAAADVIKQARTFDEAVQLFSKMRTTHGWGYVLASFNEKRAGTVEMTNRRVELRESTNGMHFQTNHFLKAVEGNLYVNRGIDDDTRGRYRRLEERITQREGFTLEQARSILGDCCDAFVGDKERGLGNTVAVHITLGSAVFDPKNKRFFVATGMAPVSQNDFIEFPFVEEFFAETFAEEKYETLKGSPPEPKIAEAVQLYIEAKMRYEYDGNTVAALDLLTRVVEADPFNSAYRFVRAILALKCGQGEIADTEFHKILSSDHTDHLKNLSEYYLGRLAARDGNRKLALSRLDRVIASPVSDEALRRAAKKAAGSVRVFGRYPFNTDRLPLMMQFADCLGY